MFHSPCDWQLQGCGENTPIPDRRLDSGTDWPVGALIQVPLFESLSKKNLIFWPYFFFLTIAVEVTLYEEILISFCSFLHIKRASKRFTVSQQPPKRNLKGQNLCGHQRVADQIADLQNVMSAYMWC